MPAPSQEVSQRLHRDDVLVALLVSGEVLGQHPDANEDHKYVKVDGHGFLVDEEFNGTLLPIAAIETAVWEMHN